MDHFIGSHHVREELDVVALTLVGDVSLQDVKRIVSIIDGVIARHGRYGGIIDIQKMGSFSPEGRRIASEWTGSGSSYGNAFFGGGFTSRVLMVLVSRVIQVTMGKLMPLGFFKTEEEARVWLAAQRGEAGKSSS